LWFSALLLSIPDIDRHASDDAENVYREEPGRFSVRRAGTVDGLADCRLFFSCSSALMALDSTEGQKAKVAMPRRFFGVLKRTTHGSCHASLFFRRYKSNEKICQ
jgi:hypothetical protein